MGLPPTLGNTSGLLRESPRASSRISRARRHSGTRCSRFPFVRGAGMLHTPSSLSFLAPSRPRSWEREKGAAGGDGGAGGELSPVGGSKGPEPLASPNVLHWVGWLPGTTRCGAGPAVPASHGHRALLRPAAVSSGRPGSPPSPPSDIIG